MTGVTDRTLRWVSVAIGAVLIVTAGVLAGHEVNPSSDDTCGQVFYDTYRADTCSHPMAVQTGWTVTIAAAGVVALAVGMIGPRGQSRRSARVVEFLLGVTAAALLLVGLNRMLQPDEAELFCGSVVNRHTTYEPVRERRCDDLLWPHRRAAIASFSGGVVAAGAAVLIAGHDRRRRRDRPAVMAEGQRTA
jgi:hypothetical protein